MKLPDTCTSADSFTYLNCTSTVNTSIYNIFKPLLSIASSYLNVSLHGNYVDVKITDKLDVKSVTVIKLMESCVLGTCSCSHHIANNLVQLKPCRLLPLLFLKGEIDVNWEFLVQGFTFGFKVVNPNFKDAYTAGNKIISDDRKSQFIHSKLISECSMGRITRVYSKPQCSHNAFCVEKSSNNGYGTIIDFQNHTVFQLIIM